MAGELSLKGVRALSERCGCVAVGHARGVWLWVACAWCVAVGHARDVWLMAFKKGRASLVSER